jgi:predicted transposase/invertase (TIGR01784 family)
VKHYPTIALTVTDFVMLHDEKLESSVITSFKFMETSQKVLFFLVPTLERGNENNAILNFRHNPIVDLIIINPYQMPLVEGLKETYVDIKAKLETGTTVLIEMQAYNQGGFGKRIQSNLAQNYSTQLQSGEKYVNYPTIALTVTDFVMLHDEKLESSVITSFKFMETSQKVLFPYNQMEMVFVELPKFNKSESELSSMADKWIYFIKQAGHLTAIPQALAVDATINHALKVANSASLTPEELEIQIKKARWLADQEDAESERKIALEKLAKMKAEKQAVEAEKQVVETALAEKETALANAEKSTALQIAKQMLQANVEIALIVQVTGLDETLIKKL